MGKSLAMDLHHAVHDFVMDMSTWIDSFYQELLSVSEASTEETWELTLSCIKKVFEELCKPWAAAASAFSDPVLISKSTKYIWVVLHLHK